MWKRYAARLVAAIFSWLFAGVAVAADAGVLTVPAEVGAGGAFQVQWSGKAEPGDFVSVDGPGDASTTYGSQYGYPANANPVPLLAPEKPGDYVVRYHLAVGYAAIASAPLKVTAVSATLDVPANVDAGGDVSVRWTGPNNAGDFVSIDKPGEPDRQYGPYAYPSAGNPLTIRAPDEAGDYEVRYHLAAGYGVIGRAALHVGAVGASLTAADTVSAGAGLDVQWKGPNQTRDYISIDEVGAADGSYGPYRYTADGNPLRIVVPDTAGDYVLRYHTGQSDKVLGTRPVKVTSVTASLTAPAEVVAGRVFEVRWQGPNNDGDFITLVPAGTEAKKYGSNNAYPKRGNPVRIEAAREAGAYEVRYLTGQAYNTLASAPLKITPDTTAGKLHVTSAPGVAAKPSFGAIELVLDASGSMLQRIGGVRRIDLAKRAFTDLTKEIPPGSGFALRVFGNKEADSCRTDLEIPLAPLDVNAAVARIGTIESKNLAKTPIGASLAKVPADLAGATGKLLVVLVTDGEETCGGDPKAAIESLRAAGLDVRVDIVGFAVDEVGLKETFQEWARVGNGGYYDAHDGAELSAAVRATLRSMYEVLDGERVVASGVVDGEPIEVPAGTYRVRVTGTARETKDVVIAAAATRDLAL